MEEQNNICGLGALFSAKDLRDYRLATLASDFPEEFELPMPEVKNQGSVGSCVAHSLATVIEFYNKKQHNLDIPMSVGYIYGNRTSSWHKDSGMITRDAIKDVCLEGDVVYDLFPVNLEVPTILELFKKNRQELAPKAEPYRFTAYVKVETEKEIKTALMNGYPVVFAIQWKKQAKVKDGVLTFDSKENSGGHCMVIYGWDSRGWKFQNSWGKSWGEGGRAILPYDMKIREAYSIIDELVGDIEINKPHKDASFWEKLFVKVVNYINFWINQMKYKRK